MRSLIKLLVVLMVCLVGIGFYRGWFSLSTSSPDKDGKKVNIDVSVDEGKMKSDVKRAKKKIREEVKELEGKVKAPEKAN